MAESEELLQLRRRARRRLLGATALVLFLVIVPPMLMDLDPKPVSSNLSVDIPSKDARGPLKPAPATPQDPARPAQEGTGAAGVAAGAAAGAAVAGAIAGAAPQSESKPPAPVEPPKPAAKDVPKPAAKDAPKPAAKDAPKPAAKDVPKEAPKVAAKDATKPPAAEAPAGEGWYVQLGVFSNRERAQEVRTKVAEAGIRAWVDQVKTASGAEQSRVRAGPFPTKDAAEKAHTRLEDVGRSLGFKPGPARQAEGRS